MPACQLKPPVFFKFLAMLLLVAIIGAIYLARRPEDDERAN